MPSYPHRHPYAYPYTITVSNPTPSLEAGIVQTFGFFVDDPIPTLEIPLANGDTVTVDFNTPYNATFESLRAYSHRVDYAILPDHFDSYSANDQERIRQVMARAAMENSA